MRFGCLLCDRFFGIYGLGFGVFLEFKIRVKWGGFGVLGVFLCYLGVLGGIEEVFFIFIRDFKF